MDYLPLEVLNKFAKNRTLYVLAASSTVNPHCNADTAEYLETAECRVEPRFESPESEDSTLTCLYKRAVLNKIAKNRTLYVLAASSTVNPHCNADTAEYLETAKCRVDPRFESPESEDSTQTCLYKKAGDKEISINESLLRGSSNHNRMWWQHCNADTAEYLETAECRVEPRFESPNSEDSTQTCFYKKAGYKEISIKKSL
ncbi:hypothetical protein J6590_083210 [Homalodisca vitripennis]|nr:hypothetical protein J6590_083210 [Homalodisca vitripennis]